MHSKTLVATLISAMLLLSALPMVAFAPQPPVNQDTFIEGSIGLPARADPATAYDTASGELIMNVYEPLIGFYRNTSETDLRQQGKIGQFVPVLAEAVGPADSTWPEGKAVTTEVIIKTLTAMVPVNETEPVCTYWEDGTGHYYHINGWRDNFPDGVLGFCDVIYVEEVTWPGKVPIYCTKFAWHVEARTPPVGNVLTITVKRTWYIFKIRQGVPIQPWKYYNGTDAPCANITCEDIEYSFERAMIEARVGGPTWMFYKPILDAMFVIDWNTSDVNELLELGRLIDCAFQQNCTHFKINVCIDFPETAWYQILAQTWGCIVPKKFAIDHGDWPGIFVNGTGYPVWKYWCLGITAWPTGSRSCLDRAPTTLAPPGYVGAVAPPGWTGSWAGHAQAAPVCVGTGPYTNTRSATGAWDTVNLMWRLDIFNNTRCGTWWKGFAPIPCTQPYYIKTFIFKSIDLWPARYGAFMAGDIDVIAVPRAYMYQLLYPNGDPLPGIVTYKNMALLSSDSLHFCFDVALGSSYMPMVGGLNCSNFFGNVHTRKAFAYALNFTALLAPTGPWYGEAEQPATWHIANLVPDYRDPSIPKYAINLTRIEEELKAAIFNLTGTPKSLWASGFTVTLLYNTGNDQRKIACDMIALAIQSLNGKPGAGTFTVNVAALPWSPDYLGAMEEMLMPCFQIGWLADFAQADNWVRPYMHTYGDFSYYQGYSNATVDNEIDLAVKTPNEPLRTTLYRDLQWTFINDVPTVMVVQPLGRAFMRNWVQGWFYNPLYPGIPVWFRWKGFTGDLNNDLVVDIFDLVIVAAQFGRPPPPITDPRADINKDGVVDIFDIVIVAAQFGSG